MLVVTGTQRSGTSAIAKCLIESGYDLGATWFDEEVQGGYENPDLCNFYSEYLGDPTFPFADFEMSEVRTLEFRMLYLQVVKFSYLLMNPTFVTIWSKFRPPSMGDTFLVMDRNKNYVVASKMRLFQRFKHDSILLQQNAEMLKYNFDKSLVLLCHLGYKVAALGFPTCLENLQLVNRQLNYLDPEVQITPEAWNKVIDESKVHF